MPLLTDEELKHVPEVDDLEAALRAPGEVLRFRAYRVEDAGRVGRIRELRRLQSLSVTLSDVSELLPHLGELTDLQWLHLQACHVPDFPAGVLELRHLRELGIGNSSLGEVPEGIGELVGLEELFLSQNSLVTLPESLGRLVRLKTLNVSYNELVAVPESIGGLERLVNLLLEVNELTAVPEGIGRLGRLQRLRLNSNRLTTLPESVCGLPKLELLTLENNPLVSLPKGLAERNSLKIELEAAKRPLFMDWAYRPGAEVPWVALEDMRLHLKPDSELYPDFLASIEEAGLEAVRGTMLEGAREAVALTTMLPEDYTVVGGSRLGGFPDLVSEDEFPMTYGQYWCFLGQLNLAELAPLNGYLPRAGLLSFFVDDTQSLNGRVIFYQGDLGALQTVRHAGADAMMNAGDDYTENGHGVKFGRFVSCPETPPGGYGRENGAVVEAYERWCEERGRVDLHLNGHTAVQHESPQELAANALRGQPEEWVPLLNLGWDGKVGFSFGDAGTLTFCIHQEALRRADFSNVHVSLETS